MNLDHHPLRSLENDVGMQALIYMYQEERMTIGDISMRTGVSPNTIRRYLRGYDPISESDERKIIASVTMDSAKEFTPVCDNYLDGETPCVTGEATEREKATKGKKTVESKKLVDDAELIRLCKLGLTNAEIAKATGYTQKTIDNKMGKLDTGMSRAERIKNGIARRKMQKAENESKSEKASEAKTVEIANVSAETDGAKFEQINGLKILSANVVLAGCLCKYEIDSKEHIMEMKEGMLNGIVDAENLSMLITELSEIRNRYI